MLDRSKLEEPPYTAMLVESIATAGKTIPTAEQFGSARRIFIDWLGVTLAGTEEPVAKIMREEFGQNVGDASILGTQLRASVADAALTNGTTSHALDYDDVQEFIGHPGAVIVAAALAVAEECNAAGEELYRAIITGFDAARFVGTLVMPGHYDHGFHSTATVCAFGATAAAAQLIDLDGQQLSNAIGLVATQAAGLKSMFGTMAKPFHAGHAASAGVMAARLAKRGLTANPCVLEANQGFLATQAHQNVPADWVQPAYGESLKHLLFKYHASCYLTHSSIEALRSLTRYTPINTADVARVILRVPFGHLNVCDIDHPQTGLETKFSLRHIAALILAGYNTAELDVFSDRFAQNSELQELRQRVEVRGDREGLFEAEATLEFVDGRRLVAIADVSNADISPQVADEKLDSKFRALVVPLLGAQGAQQLLDLSHSLPSLRVNAVVADINTATL